MSYYAVAVGRIPGIYPSWAEAEMQVRGFSGALYQKFSRRDQAEQFIQIRGIYTPPTLPAPITSLVRLAPPAPITSPAPLVLPILPAASSSSTFFSQDTVFTDGSFAGGLAGYGWVFIPKFSENHTLSGYGPVVGKLTNNTGELTAILNALNTIPNRPLDIYTDSEYSLKCVTQWYSRWEKNGFRTTKGTPVANIELIQAIRARMDGVAFFHVKAHVGHIWNEMADKLANLGRMVKTD